MMKRETGFSGKQSVKYVIGENRKVYRKMLKNSFHYIYAQTTWSKGDMRLTTLVSGVQTVLECAKESSGKIAGVDICGEADAEAVHENEANDYANEKLLEVFEGLFGKSDCE